MPGRDSLPMIWGTPGYLGSGMRLYLPKSERTALMQLWTPRIGTVASRMYVVGRYCAAIAPSLGISVLALGFIQHQYPSAALSAIAWVILAVGVAAGALALFLPLLMWPVVGKQLGLKINLRTSPPTDAASYERWCSDRGVEPYSAE